MEVAELKCALSEDLPMNQNIHMGVAPMANIGQVETRSAVYDGRVEQLCSPQRYGHLEPISFYMDFDFDMLQPRNTLNSRFFPNEQAARCIGRQRYGGVRRSTLSLP